MIDHDRLFKELLSTFFVDFLSLFFPEVLAYIDRNSISFEDKEIFTDVTAGERYEADLLVCRGGFCTRVICEMAQLLLNPPVHIREQESFLLIHVEPQAYPQANFDRRMFRYFARLSEKSGLPVYPIAILSYDSPKLPQPNVYRVEFPDKLVLEFNYAVIQLNRLNWRDFLQHSNPVASALMAKMNIATQDRPKVKSECLRLLATLRLEPARMQLISGFIDTYLRLNAEEEVIFKAEVAKFEPVQQEEVMEIETSWEIKGKQKGKQEEALALIMRLLPRRIGAVESQLQERIGGLSLTQLEDLAEALLDFSNAEDLVHWLGS